MVGYGDLLVKVMNNPDRCYEPVQRNKDGMRWIRHRFPIKGGITWRDVLHQDMMGTNALYRRLVEKGAIRDTTTP